jgi:hypothetical protein
MHRVTEADQVSVVDVTLWSQVEEILPHEQDPREDALLLAWIDDLHTPGPTWLVHRDASPRHHRTGYAYCDPTQLDEHSQWGVSEVNLDPEFDADLAAVFGHRNLRCSFSSRIRPIPDAVVMPCRRSCAAAASSSTTSESTDVPIRRSASW